MPSVVYFTRDITPNSLVRIYDALKCTMSGNIAKHGLRIPDAVQALGLGSKDYILMTI